MRKLFLGLAAVCALCLTPITASAGENGWVLDGAASTVAFGSVKKDTVGESHNFAGLAGSMNHDGEVSVEIDLSSVETWIDVRNERIVEHVFNNAPSATYTGTIDLEALETLAVGDMAEVNVKGALQLGGVSLPVDTDMIVVRLSEVRVMVVTAEMIWVSTADAGIDGGVSMLQELASLSGITRTFPVTLRLVFDHKM